MRASRGMLARTKARTFTIELPPVAAERLRRAAKALRRSEESVVLEPFAHLASQYDEPNKMPDICPVRAAPESLEARIATVGDLRQARAALKEGS